MKDSFFEWLDRVHLKIYKTVTKIAYLALVRKRSNQGQTLTTEEKKRVKNYWRQYGFTHVPMQEYKWYKKQGLEVTGRIIPDVIWHSIIEPHFNSYIMEKGFEDKNYFETIIGKENSPSTLIHCVNGQLLDKNYMGIDLETTIQAISAYKSVICKPSVDTGGGRGIIFINAGEIDCKKFKEIESLYNGNFIVQKIVHQHPFFAAFNPSALNTMRIMTLLFEGKVHFLSGFLRVGAEGSRVDNVSNGGRYIQIMKDGTLGNRAISEDLRNHDLVFTDRNVEQREIIPNWDRIWETIERAQYKLPHFRLINWDVALSEDGVPIIIEYNLMDSSSYFHQVNCGPIFGELTEKVLSEVFSDKKRQAK